MLNKKHIFINFIRLPWIVIVLVSCANSDAKEYERSVNAKIEALTANIRDCIMTQDVDKLMPLAVEMRNLGKEVENDKVYLNGLIYIIQTQYSAYGDMDSLFIDEALRSAQQQNDNAALAKLLNVMALDALYNKSDYFKGMSYLLEGVRYAQAQTEDHHPLFALKANLALASYFWNDPAGLSYAMDMYELGKLHDDEYLIFSGSVIMAYMHNLAGNNLSALKYIEPAIGLAEKYGEQCGVYSICGDILSSMGEDAAAAEYYKKAIAERKGTERLADISAYVGYGTYLCEQQKFDEALEIMNEGLVQIENSPMVPPKTYLLYLTISETYEAIGDTCAALRYYKLYHDATDAMFDIEKERAVGKWKMQYEKEKYEKELEASDRKLQISILFLAIAAITVVAISVFHYYKDRNYRQILKRHHNALEKEKWYRRRLEQYTADVPYGGDYSKYDKYSDLFSRLEKLMNDNKLYRKQGLTRDETAKLLSTNRTYLSAAISHHTGLSFVYYVNSYRLREAVEVLSDSGNDIPIKALEEQLGFNSHTTFYRLFKEATGLPPSQFRAEMS